MFWALEIPFKTGFTVSSSNSKLILPLTNSFQQSHAWKADSHSDGHEVLWLIIVATRIWHCPHRHTTIPLRSISKLSSHLRIRLPRSLFPSGLQNKNFVKHFSAHPRPSWFYRHNNVWQRIHITHEVKDAGNPSNQKIAEPLNKCPSNAIQK
jgi:hypothetical protein